MAAHGDSPNTLTYIYHCCNSCRGSHPETSSTAIHCPLPTATPCIRAGGTGKTEGRWSSVHNRAHSSAFTERWTANPAMVVVLLWARWVYQLWACIYSTVVLLKRRIFTIIGHLTAGDLTRTQPIGFWKRVVQLYRLSSRHPRAVAMHRDAQHTRQRPRGCVRQGDEHCTDQRLPASSLTAFCRRQRYDAS